VSCSGSSFTEASHGIEDFVGGLGPHEGLGVLVVDLDVSPEVVFETLDAFVGGPADLLVREGGEPALYEINP
jgi:hypothetical protein